MYIMQKLQICIGSTAGRAVKRQVTCLLLFVLCHNSLASTVELIRRHHAVPGLPPLPMPLIVRQTNHKPCVQQYKRSQASKDCKRNEEDIIAALSILDIHMAPDCKPPDKIHKRSALMKSPVLH